ncbi:MAG TPA: hypothetical protein VEK12_02730 [Alphaproteobacteria bacterium]|nr:hypothetical protein [Alphaproteobacteria bacterium]
MFRSRPWAIILAAATCLALAAGGQGVRWTAQAQQPQKGQSERGSAIGTPLPVGKVEAAPIAPPPLSDAEKEALAKLGAATSELDGLAQKLADESGALAGLARWLVYLAIAQIFVLVTQLWLLRFRRAPLKKPRAAEAKPAAPPAVPPEGAG